LFGGEITFVAGKAILFAGSENEEVVGAHDRCVLRT
jgi:hypothetical protein